MNKNVRNELPRIIDYRLQDKYKEWIIYNICMYKFKIQDCGSNPRYCPLKLDP